MQDVLCSAAVMKHYSQKQRKEGIILACHPTGLDAYNGGGRDRGRGRKLRSHLSHTQVAETVGRKWDKVTSPQSHLPVAYFLKQSSTC